MPSAPVVHRVALRIAPLLVPVILFGLVVGNSIVVGIATVAALTLIAIGITGYGHFQAFSFTAWVLVAVSIAMFFPQYVAEIRGYDTADLIVPLVQVIMFGMGTALSVRDFTGIFRSPRKLLVGLACQFSIMPLVGLAVALLFRFPAEIAAGIVLVGSAPGGVASNVMTYIARGDLALSIALTSAATLVAPIMTPFLMESLAGQFVPISFIEMMLSIVSMVLIPIGAALVFNRLVRNLAPWILDIMPRVSMISIIVVLAFITAAGRDALLGIGALLILAVMIHNGAGFLLGYWGARLARLDERTCRTVAIEVGMQNGGLAGGIAAEMGRVGTMGLAPAVFSSWHNISGSILANWWRNRPIPEPAEDPAGRQAVSETNATAGD